jgi:putative acetyltransferase
MGIDLNFSYRPARATDITELAALHRRAILAGGTACYTPTECESWAAGLNPDFYENALAEATLFEIAEDSSGIIAAFGASRGDEIWLMYTDASCMGRGIGGALLARLGADIAARGHAVMTLRASLNAEGFYAARGWRKVETFRHTTRGGLVLTAVKMEKPALSAP